MGSGSNPGFPFASGGLWGLTAGGRMDSPYAWNREVFGFVASVAMARGIWLTRPRRFPVGARGQTAAGGLAVVWGGAYWGTPKEYRFLAVRMRMVWPTRAGVARICSLSLFWARIVGVLAAASITVTTPFSEAK